MLDTQVGREFLHYNATDEYLFYSIELTTHVLYKGAKERKRGRGMTKRHSSSFFLTVLVETVSDGLPVDNLPNGLEVIGTNVLVLEVVSVLPNVNAQKRNQTSGGLERILVRGSGNLKALELLVVAEPTPARSLNGSGLGVELFNELVKRTPGLLNLLEKLSSGLLTATAGLGGQVLPEESVVDVS
jgi:hypothetical protein